MIFFLSKKRNDRYNLWLRVINAFSGPSTELITIFLVDQAEVKDRFLIF